MSRKQKPCGFYNPPPLDRRCQRRSSMTLERCKKWAIKDSKFCYRHGGKKLGRKGLKARGEKGLLMYRAYLSKTLQQRLDEFTGMSHLELTQLYEELSLSRLTVCDCVEMFRIAHEVSEEGKPLAKVETRIAAGNMLREALDDVKDLCEAVNKIEAAAKDKVSLHVLSLFVEQVVRAIYKAFPDDNEAAQRIEKFIRTEVKFPSASSDSGEEVMKPAALTALMDQSTLGDLTTTADASLGVQQREGHDDGIRNK